MVKTRSGKTYRKKPDIPLMRIHDLLPKIISKMHNLELVRMRRTCSAVNKLVEKRTKILSKRVMIDDFVVESLINLCFEINEGENRIVLYANGLGKKFEGNLKQHLGPFTINRIHVRYNDKCSTDKHKETVQWLRQMNLSCSRLIVDRLPVQFTLDILESLEHVAEVDLDFELRLTTEDLHLLSSSRRVGIIELDVRRANLHKVPVEMIKKFKKIAIFCYRAQALRNMIEDIQSTNDCGNLEKIGFKTDYDLEEVEFPFPKLWEGEETTAEMSRRLDSKPFAIYWKELQNKQMVLVHAEPHGYSPEFEFSFFEKGSTALTDFLMENMRTRDMKIKKEMTNFREDFAQAGFEEKCKLLKEAVYKSDCRLFTMCSRRSAPSSVRQPYSSDTESENMTLKTHLIGITRCF